MALPKLSAHGCLIEYRWVGEKTPGRPTLVFLHQGLGCAALWRDFPERLSAATGCPAFAYSRQGYGGSDFAEWPRAHDWLEVEGRDRLPAVLAAAGIDDLILIGHSDGGTVALVYGATVKAGLRGIITEAAHVFAEKATQDAVARTREVYKTTELREKLRKYHGDNVDSAFYSWAETWLQPGYIDMSIEHLVPQIEVPVLAIRGVRDKHGSQRQLECLPELATCPVEAVAPDCDHAPHEEMTEEMLALMAGFVTRLVG